MKLKTFNDTGLPTHLFRQKLVEYYKYHKKGQMKLYRPSYFCANMYIDINLNSIQIEADTRLACVIIFLDFLNSNVKSSSDTDEYVDCFDKFCCIFEKEIENLEEIDFSDLNNLFKFKNIDLVVDGFVNGYFSNDTSWFVEINTNKNLLSISDDMK